ncbi:MAG: glycogen synthase GlgA [Thermodesulfobacteriota bacterium]|nr:glycogen synthase GlgA [Thermodesulfobacteriota bacterium]
MSEKNLRILFISPEAVPFAKTGGLADVSGSLPAALKKLGMNIRMVLPFYRIVKNRNFYVHPLIDDLEIPLGAEKLISRVMETKSEEEVPVYLIEREDLYDRPNLYGSTEGDYYDNLERFTYFAYGALRIAETLDFKPDIVHCHDWQTGLIPALLKGPFHSSTSFSDTSTVFTIHNIGYQGLFPADRLPMTGLRPDEFFHLEGIEYWGKISLLKAGIVYADAVTTVSEKYAEEIQTPEFGMGMEGILSKRRTSLFGILNGTDYKHWDPASDPHIHMNYDSKKMEGKQSCKESLFQELSLDPAFMKRPLLGVVSRLDAQKGLDLLVSILEDILRLDVSLVVLASKDKHIQQEILNMKKRAPSRIALFIGFNEPLAHRIIAGADIFLIPSRYEPCGLTQMYALKYGTIPVVRATGGLEDTITAFNPERGEGNGFKFDLYEPTALLGAIRQAVEIFQDPKSWNQIMANSMKVDFSWNRSAGRYMELYRSIIKE